VLFPEQPRKYEGHCEVTRVMNYVPDQIRSSFHAMSGPSVHS
jgi:hypothetical protein